jgi:amidophosphoribosyltransferase
MVESTSSAYLGVMIDMADDDDSLHEECGVFGVFGVENASAVAALGLHALQHRGQEGCGIASFHAGRFTPERHRGLVGEHFATPDLTKRLPGDRAIGHVRYSTQGGSVARNLQPFYADLDCGGFAIAHNGNLTNSTALRDELVAQGSIFGSLSDTEVIPHLVARSRGANLIERFLDALAQIQGGYALVAMTQKKLIGARDPIGIRPLVLGRIEDAYVLASETCALDRVGASFVRDVEPGEVIVVTDQGLRSIKTAPERRPRTCSFEYIYFARPDSVIDGISVYEARKAMGRILAHETPVDADIVVPVPDSGVAAALGYAHASGLPYELGLIRSHFTGRTFIQPSQEIRDLGVRMKHQANAAALAGKRVVLIDDSIVRGTTSRKIVNMVREAGATEVHFRSACPPIKHPDFYGIDMPDQKKLLASRFDNLADMARDLDVDTLRFISLDGLYRAITGGPRNAAAPSLTDHYFTGDYPTPLLDEMRKSARGEKQLSFLDAE